MTKTDLTNIKQFSREELADEICALGLKKYRAGQILEWIYRHHAGSFEDMTNISKAERDVLSCKFTIPALRLLKAERSRDGTQKFLFALEDGHTIESVLIPDEDRSTLCISSQVGCAQACRFCLTGAEAFAEISAVLKLRTRCSPLKVLFVPQRTRRTRKTGRRAGTSRTSC